MGIQFDFPFSIWLLSLTLSLCTRVTLGQQMNQLCYHVILQMSYTTRAERKTKIRLFGVKVDVLSVKIVYIQVTKIDNNGLSVLKKKLEINNYHVCATFLVA